MILIKKVKFFRLLCLSKIDREKVFTDVLDRNEGFQDFQNEKGNICLFPKVKQLVKQFPHSNCNFVIRMDGSVDDKIIRRKFFRVQNRVERF